MEKGFKDFIIMKLSNFRFNYILDNAFRILVDRKIAEIFLRYTHIKSQVYVERWFLLD